jgi:GH24 family phage-related lysozyme (muramidase)
MREEYLIAIRKFEGFATRAAWDYKQASSGYGTRANFVGEVIDRAEAEKRFRTEISEAHRAVKKFAPNLDEGSAAALTSLTFNAGTSWMKSGLGAAVKSSDLESVRAIIMEYNKAGGKVLPGLVNRRSAEANWIGNAGVAQPNSPSEVGSSAAAPSGLGQVREASATAKGWTASVNVVAGIQSSMLVDHAVVGSDGGRQEQAAGDGSEYLGGTGVSHALDVVSPSNDDGTYSQIALMMVGLPRQPATRARQETEERKSIDRRLLQPKTAVT